MTHELASLSASLSRDRQRSEKYLSFLLGAQEYALPVLRVREIIRQQEATPVPEAPAHVLGVFNLRGQVIPLVDLRRRLGMPDLVQGRPPCVVVVQMAPAQQARLLGLQVDAVCEVLALSAADVENPPSFGAGVEVPCLLGLAKVRGQVKILLNLDQVVHGRDLACAKELAAADADARVAG